MPLLRHQPMPQVPESPGASANITFTGPLQVLPTFRSVEKTLGEAVQLLLKNEQLGKLLYYTDRHAEKMPALTQDQTMTLLNNQIKIVPRLDLERDAKPYIIVGLDNFIPDAGSTEFRSATLSFDILAPYDHWLLDDFRLRPYAIAGEIDGLINNAGLQNRTATFLGAKQLILSSELGGVVLYYDLDTSFDVGSD